MLSIEKPTYNNIVKPFSFQNYSANIAYVDKFVFFLLFCCAMLIDSDRDLMSYTRLESRGIFLYIPLGALGYMIQLACKVNL